MLVLLVLVVEQVLGRGVSLEPGRELRNGQLGHGEGLFFFLESVLLATVELAFFLFLLTHKQDYEHSPEQQVGSLSFRSLSSCFCP